MTPQQTAESNSGQQRPARKVWFRSIAVGLPLILGAVLIDLLLIKMGWLVRDPQTGWYRFQQPPVYIQEPGYELTGHRYLHDPKLGWRNIPGWSATTKGRPLTINRLGLRGRDYPYEKPAGTKRILVLGDSYIWGYGVGDDEVITEVLQGQIASRSAKWEVLNTAVSGWGTDQEYLFLIDEGFDYSPDIVVLAYFIVNDHKNILHSEQYGISKPMFVNTGLELVNVPVPRPGQQTPIPESDANPVFLTVSILEAMLRACVERRCNLVVMKFGEFLWPVDHDFQMLSKLFAAFAEAKQGAYFLDLDAAYAKRGFTVPQLTEGNDDGHWNAFGHQASAEILHDFLLRENLLGTASQH